MAATSTTQIFVGPLLDLVGPSAPAARESADHTIFDALLQPPAPPLPPQDLPNERPPAQKSDEHRGAPESRAPDELNDLTESQPPASESADHVRSETNDSQDISELSIEAPAQPEVPSEDASPENQEQQIAAESLAGLAAIVLLQGEAPDVSVGQVESAEIQEVAIIQEVTTVGDDGSHPAPKKAARKISSGGVGAPANQNVVSQAVEPIQAEGEPIAADSKPKDPTEEAARSTEAIAPVTAPLSHSVNVAAKIAQEPDEAVPAAVSETQKLVELVGNGGERNEQEPVTHGQSLERAVTAVTDPVQAPQLSEIQKSTPPAAAIAAPISQPATTSASSMREPAIGPIASTPRRPLAGNEAALRATEGTSRRGVVPIDTTRLLHRVARAVAIANSQDSEIRLRLSPPELGSLKLQVQVVEGALSVRCEAETAAARTALLDNLPALRERLAEQGVRIERFDVDLMQRQGAGTPDRPHDQERGTPEPLPRSEPRRETRMPITPERPTPMATDSAGRLNIII